MITVTQEIEAEVLGSLRRLEPLRVIQRACLNTETNTIVHARTLRHLHLRATGICGGRSGCESARMRR